MFSPRDHNGQARLPSTSIARTREADPFHDSCRPKPTKAAPSSPIPAITAKRYHHHLPDRPDAPGPIRHPSGTLTHSMHQPRQRHGQHTIAAVLQHLNKRDSTNQPQTPRYPDCGSPGAADKDSSDLVLHISNNFTVWTSTWTVHEQSLPRCCGCATASSPQLGQHTDITLCSGCRDIRYFNPRGGDSTQTTPNAFLPSARVAGTNGHTVTQRCEDLSR